MRLKTKAKPVQYRKICLVNTVHIPGDGYRLHYRGIAVPDIKNMISFVIIRANQEFAVVTGLPKISVCVELWFMYLRKAQNSFIFIMALSHQKLRCKHCFLNSLNRKTGFTITVKNRGVDSGSPENVGSFHRVHSEHKSVYLPGCVPQPLHPNGQGACG